MAGREPQLQGHQRRAGTEDPNSIYNYFAEMARFREKTPALIYGDYQDIDSQNAKIFAYSERWGRKVLPFFRSL